MITETGSLRLKIQLKFEKEPFSNKKEFQEGRIYEKKNHLHNSLLSRFDTFSKLPT